MNAIPKPTRTKLLAVNPETIAPRKPTMLIYGPPGVGKTWNILSYPRCYFIDSEGGADLDHYREKLRDAGGAYMGIDQGSQDLSIVVDQVKALATEKHPFKTIVVDSITKLWSLALSDEQERLGSKDAFGAFKKLPLRQFASMIKWINRLDMNAVFIAHQKDLWGLSDTKQREMIGYAPDAPDKLEYELHLTLRIARVGSSRYAYVGKSRLPAFPEGENFPWSYENFAERYGRDVIEADSKPIVLATAEQIAEIERLLDTVRLPAGQADKWLAAASADTWAEVDSDKAEKVITALKARLMA